MTCACLIGRRGDGTCDSVSCLTNTLLMGSLEGNLLVLQSETRIVHRICNQHETRMHSSSISLHIALPEKARKSLCSFMIATFLPIPSSGGDSLWISDSATGSALSSTPSPCQTYLCTLLIWAAFSIPSTPMKQELPNGPIHHMTLSIHLSPSQLW